MQVSKKPYFMTNEEWYILDDVTGEIKLTEKAPPEAVESYKKYMKQIEEMEEEMYPLFDDEKNEEKAKQLFGL